MSFIDYLLVIFSLIGVLCIYYKEYKSISAWRTKRKYFTLYPFLCLIFLIPFMLVLIIGIILECPQMVEIFFYSDPTSGLEDDGSYWKKISLSRKIFDVFYVISFFILEIYLVIQFCLLLK